MLHGRTAAVRGCRTIRCATSGQAPGWAGPPGLWCARPGQHAFDCWLAEDATPDLLACRAKFHPDALTGSSATVPGHRIPITRVLQPRFRQGPPSALHLTSRGAVLRDGALLVPLSECNAAWAALKILGGLPFTFASRHLGVWNIFLVWIVTDRRCNHISL